MTRRRGPAVLLALATLAGCVAAPTRRAPLIGVAPPERWTAASGAEVAATEAPHAFWWQGFGDPRLDRLVAEALERNHDLAIAAARLERVAAEATIAGADLAPSVGLGLDASRQRQNFVGFPIPGAGSVLSTTSTRFGASVTASWEPDLWGRLRAATRAAVAESQATEADLRGARLSLVGRTAKGWFALLEARRQLELAESSAASFRDTADWVRERYASGLRPALDLRLARANLASAEGLVSLRRDRLDTAIRQLEILLGRYPSGRLAEPGEATPRLPDVPAGLPAELVGRRPDLVAAERRLVAADQRYLVARRSLYPRLRLTASGGTVSDGLRDLLDGDFGVWSLVGGLVQPLFQGGRLRAEVTRADAAADEALAAYASAALRAYGEVEVALTSSALLAERELHLRARAGQLNAAARLAGERYRAGVGDYLTVLTAESGALDAKAELLEIERLRLDNRVDLHLALGGWLDTGDGAPEEPPSGMDEAS